MDLAPDTLLHYIPPVELQARVHSVHSHSRQVNLIPLSLSVMFGIVYSNASWGGESYRLPVVRDQSSVELLNLIYCIRGLWYLSVIWYCTFRMNIMGKLDLWADQLAFVLSFYCTLSRTCSYAEVRAERRREFGLEETSPDMATSSSMKVWRRDSTIKYKWGIVKNVTITYSIQVS